MLRLGVVGAAGRMGQRLCQLLADSQSAQLAAALRHRRPLQLPPGSQALITGDPAALAAAVDVVVDFSAPAGCAAILPACLAARTPYLVASTALPAKDADSLRAAGAQLPVMLSANLSVGIYVLGQLLQQAAAALPNFTLDLLEVHHVHKRDAPSGTALALLEAARLARPELQGGPGVFGQDVARDPKVACLHAVRGGDVAGEHHAWLLGDGERLELTHRSHDGLLFARGALQAASWLVLQPPGFYQMADMVALPAATRA